ncbi:MAG TPA: sigma-54 dependent transcriptional regulator [Thiobacillaceae bacterium]|nr:sigma-54 dependent transcriptional regulator [Thiobacillaceae bacterium]
MGKRPIILVVEDDPAFSELLSLHLEDQAYRVCLAPTLSRARDILEDQAPDALLLDYRLPDEDGLALLEELHARHAKLPVIILTGVADTDLTIDAIKAGAYDFIRKPVDVAQLDAALHHALDTGQPARSMDMDGADEQAGVEGIVGGSQAILDICKLIGRVAPTQASVLITGESGTGKEVVARAIHRHSGRRGQFLAVNCSAIVETLLENELFGHEKGSYTGADSRTEGKFEQAREGTLFLDEIGDLPLALQAKLLRVLQEGGFERVGGTQTLHSDVRIVAATNRELGAMLESGAFREDLYYRLAVVSIHIPPLRERPGDLVPLLHHLLARITREQGKAVRGISETAWQAIRAYSWPGNVRELENVLTRAVVLAQDDILSADLLTLADPMPPQAVMQPAAANVPAILSLDELETRHVRYVLDSTHWHKGKACAILGISRPALDRKLKKLLSP